MIRHMITTVDNPFDPFTQFEAWLSFDVSHGYQTIPLLGRVARTSDEMSDADRALANEQAIDEIIRDLGSEVYRKVSKQTEETVLS